MRDLIDKWWSTAAVIISLVCLWWIATYPPSGWAPIKDDYIALAAMLVLFCYGMGMILSMTERDVRRVLGYQPLPKHEEVTTTSSAPMVTPTSLPGHQDAVGSFYQPSDQERAALLFGSRTTGKSQFLQTYLDGLLQSVKTTELILVRDVPDLQNRTREIHERIKTSKLPTVVSSSRLRNTFVIDQRRAVYIVVADIERPMPTIGRVFSSIVISDSLKGHEPPWVADLIAVNDLKKLGSVCSYPRCNCPADHPGTQGWCLRGLPTEN